MSTEDVASLGRIVLQCPTRDSDRNKRKDEEDRRTSFSF